jgi:hypothetical protein
MGNRSESEAKTPVTTVYSLLHNPLGLSVLIRLGKIHYN